MRDGYIVETTCPHCGKVNDYAQPVGLDDTPPEDGSVSLCIGCGSPGIFHLGGQHLRLPTPSEYLELAHDPEFQLAMLSWKQITKNQPQGEPQ